MIIKNLRFNILMPKGNVSLKITIFIASIFGAVGFLIWSISLTRAGTSSIWTWAGGIIVAFISFVITFLSRWLK